MIEDARERAIEIAEARTSTVDKQAKGSREAAGSGPVAIPGELSPAWRETLAALSPRGTRPECDFLNECDVRSGGLLSGAEKRRRAARGRGDARRRSGAVQGPRRYVTDGEMWAAGGEWE